MRSELVSWVQDAETPREPELAVSPVTPDQQQALDVFFNATVERVSRQLNSVRSASSAIDFARDEAEDSIVRSDTRNIVANSIASRTVGVEIRGALALSAIESKEGTSGIHVNSAALRELRERADSILQKASAELPDDSEARECFEWDAESNVRISRRSFPDFKEQPLKKWLNQKASKQLFDALNRPIAIARDAQGRPSLNPELWGVWPACDRALAACRSVFRAAELRRLTEQVPPTAVRARYETLPALRSREPNLTFYRKQKIPVFQPRRGHIFLAGRVDDLWLSCFAAVCLKNQFIRPKGSRLCNYLFQKDDSDDVERPIEKIARELYVAEAVQEFHPSRPSPE